MSFKEDLEELLNKYSMEVGSNTPDFILAEYMMDCYHSFNKAVNSRLQWYGERLLVLPDSVAEQRDAPVHAGQKCPYCNGRKKVYAWFKWTRCPECKGTGISNRPAGG